MTASHQTAIDFEDAQTGRGTRYMSLDDARHFLEFCTQRGWAFQSLEVSEVIGERELPRIDLSLLGLTKAENVAASPSELESVARDVLARAESERRQFIVKIWIDNANDMLAKTRGR